MNLQQAFSQSRKAVPSGIKGNVILQATEFTKDTVKGTVLTGTGAGTNIEVRYGGHLGQKDYVKKNGKSFVDIENGGTLRIERLEPGKGADAPYRCKWMKTFHGKPDKAQALKVDALCCYEPRGKDNEGRPRTFINALRLDGEQHVTSLAEMKSAMVEALEQCANVHIFGQTSDGKQTIDHGSHISGKMVDGAWTPLDPAERVDQIMKSLEENDYLPVIEDMLANTGISVVPAESFRIGAETAEAVATTLKEASENKTNAMISTVDPRSWKLAGLGVRLSHAIAGAKYRNELSQDREDLLVDRFMAFAAESGVPENQMDAFTSRGWSGLSNDTVKRFMESGGVELQGHGRDDGTGWSTECLLLKGFADQGDRAPDLVIKSFQTQGTTAYPPVQAFKEVRKGYYVEMVDAIEGLLDSGPAKGAEANAGNPETRKPKTAREDGPTEDADNLDAILQDAVGDMDMN